MGSRIRPSFSSPFFCLSGKVARFSHYKMGVSRNLFMDFERDGLAGRLGFGDLFKSSCSKEKGGGKMRMRSVWELGGLGKDSFSSFELSFSS